MRIGINLLYLIPGVVGGTETYAAGLLRGLALLNKADDFFIFTNRQSATWPLPDDGHFARISCPVSATRPPLRHALEQALLPAYAARLRLDVLHSLGYVTPLLARCASVVTIPDLNCFALEREMGRVRARILRALIGLSARSARSIITLSEFSKSEISRRLSVSPDRLFVTYLAPRPGQEEHGPRAHPSDQVEVARQRPYMIAFSSRSPHKNIALLVRAFGLARERSSVTHDLVIVGNTPIGWNGAFDSAGEIPAWVTLTGYLRNDVLDATLQGADALLFPSLYEGFGLPVVEAMAMGVSVLCSNRACLPEVAGGAALLCDASSVDDVSCGISQLALDRGLRSRLREQGLRRARRFSWESTARETLKAYECALRPPGEP